VLEECGINVKRNDVQENIMIHLSKQIRNTSEKNLPRTDE